MEEWQKVRDVHMGDNMGIVRMGSGNRAVSLPLSSSDFVGNFFNLLGRAGSGTTTVSRGGNSILRALSTIIRFSGIIHSGVSILVNRGAYGGIFNSILPSSSRFLSFFTRLEPVIRSRIRGHTTGVGGCDTRHINDIWCTTQPPARQLRKLSSSRKLPGQRSSFTYTK